MLIPPQSVFSCYLQAETGGDLAHILTLYNISLPQNRGEADEQSRSPAPLRPNPKPKDPGTLSFVGQTNGGDSEASSE